MLPTFDLVIQDTPQWNDTIERMERGRSSIPWGPWEAVGLQSSGASRWI